MRPPGRAWRSTTVMAVRGPCGPPGRARWRAEREGWIGEAEGLRVSLTAAKEKLIDVDSAIQRRRTAINLGMPTFPMVVARTVVAPADTASTEWTAPRNSGREA